MILGAYAFLVVAVIADLRGSIPRVPRRLERLARALGAIAGAAFICIAALLITKNHATPLGRVVLAVLAVGGCVYLSGLVHWRVPAGFVFRRAGWFAILAALVVPTTLTLLMPIAALLALTLRASGASSRNAGGGRRALAR